MIYCLPLPGDDFNQFIFISDEWFGIEDKQKG